MKKILGLALCILLAVSFEFVSCANDDESVSSPVNTATTGTVSTATTNTSGAKTATLEATSGSYTFTENLPATTNIVARAAVDGTKGGVWTFTEKGKTTPKYSGTYKGDISQFGNGEVSLMLTVEQMQNSQGVLVAVQSTKSFSLNATKTSFTAEIPTVTESSIEIPAEDASKTDSVLIKEANAALVAGDYDTAVAKFKSAWKKNPSDANKIYYALTELVTLSTDKELSDIIKNKLGVTDYPATLNAIFTTDWLKEYPRIKKIYAEKCEKNPAGSYLRVSGTPTSTYDNGSLSVHYILYDGGGIDIWHYSGGYLTNITPDANGKYLISFSSYYDTLDTSSYAARAQTAVADYLYNCSSNYSDGTYTYTVTKSDSGNYVRLNGTENSSYTGLSVAYKFADEKWNNTYTYLTDCTLSSSGNYLVDKSRFCSYYAYNLAKTGLNLADYLYDAGDGYKTNLFGSIDTIPALATPSWASSTDYYKNTLIGTTQSYTTWWYLLYANAVTNHENGFNDTIDSLLSIFDKMTTAIKGIVDLLGTGTATLEPEIIANLKLTKILGEEAVSFGKTEMNVLVSALESMDAVLNFAASYDLSADLNIAKVGFDRTSEDLLNIINSCVTAKTLTVRDANKMTAAKTLFVDALSRLITSYDDIKSSTTYPQAAKDKIAEYGDLIYDGAIKAKSAIENGTVLYVPNFKKNPKIFPTSADTAAFGIDMGKIFTPGYFTRAIERSDDLATIKFYYKRIEETDGSATNYRTITTESALTEITNISDFFANTIKDAGSTYTYDSSYTRTCIRYKVGILANNKIITDALPGSQTSIVEELRFIPLFTISKVPAK